ncbi:MAG TPA: sulfotransferase [Steroidobacteraceae bacterium]|nr:sulfotransferase [Steroidobacteraceae bacterium]
MTATDAARAVALLQAGRAAEAEALASQWLARDPRHGAAWACLGFAQLQQGRDPLPALDSAARLLPQDASVQHALGQALEERGQLPRAAQCLQRAVELRPDFAEAHDDLGRVRLALGDVEGAVASGRKAIELRPELAAAHGNLANAERARGALDAAIAGYQRVVGLEPELALGHRELARALIAADRADEALPHLERLVKLQPDAETLSDYATLLVSLGRYAEAVSRYRAAIERAPKDARLHSNLAHALHCAGEHHGAIEAARKALSLDGRLPEAWLHLGNALLAHSEVPQAEASYRDGLALAPEHVGLLAAHAMALRALSRIDDAEAVAARALALRRSPDLLALCGNLAADRGRFDEAGECFAEALALAPELPEALVGVTRTRRMTNSDQAWLAAAQRALAHGVPAAHAANLQHAVGKYHEDLGQADAAFAAHAAANALARRSGLGYDRAATTARVDAIIAAYDRATLAALRMAGAGVASTRPVFVVGMPRSGTTLVEQMLATHPDVHGADELLFWNLAAEPARRGSVGERAALMARLGAEYLAQLERLAPSAARVVDKLPGNFENIGLIHAALPGAKFIHLGRDARDTCLSIFFQGFTSAHAYATDLGDLAHYYREYRRLMAHWRAVLPPGVLLDLQYEALVADAEAGIRRMLAHIDLPWDARCLEFHRTERTVLTASAWQVRQPLNSGSIGRWKRYERFLAPLLSALEGEAAGLGAAT